MQVYQCKLRRACLGDSAPAGNGTAILASGDLAPLPDGGGAASAAAAGTALPPAGTARRSPDGQRATAIPHAARGQSAPGQGDGPGGGPGGRDPQSSATCAPGFHGPLCSVCDVGYFQFSNTCT